MQCGGSVSITFVFFIYIGVAGQVAAGRAWHSLRSFTKPSYSPHCINTNVSSKRTRTMTTDRNKRIKSIGNFLSTYYSDLNYVRQFQDFKNERLTSTEYLKKSTGTFYQFLIEFRVMRNVKKEKVGV